MPPLPVFSIIIPSLNEAKYLPSLLKDLSLQSFKDFEVIVVDGHSQDATVAKAQAFSPSLPSLTLINSIIRNVSSQRNQGVNFAKADWLIFTDADNRLPPYFLQGIKFRIEEQKPKILSVYINLDTTKLEHKALAKLTNLYIQVQKNTLNPYCLESLLVINKSTFNQLHGFNDKIKWGEGNDLLRRAAKKKIHLTFCPSPTYTYSTRRLRKEGNLKLTSNIAYNEFCRLFDIPIDTSKIDRLYPMKGGAYFDKSKKTSTIELVIHQLTKPRSLLNTFKILDFAPKIQKKLKLDEWLRG